MAGSEQPKWRRRKDARPNEIVDAALDAFAERGFAATRLDDVARRAGVSKGTLYLYFRNKEDLFKAVIREAILPNLAMAEAILEQDTGSTRELLTKVIGGFMGVVGGTKVGAIPKLIIAEANNFPDVARFYATEVVARALRILSGILQRGIERGELREFNPALAAPVVAGPMMLFVLWKHVLEPHTDMSLDPAGYLQTYVDLVFNGMLREAASEEGTP